MLTRVPDVNGVKDTVRWLASKANDPHDTGFVSCKYKKDLLELLWYIEDTLENCSSFGDVEREWHQERTLQLLKRKNR